MQIYGKFEGFPQKIVHCSGQIIATSAEVTPNGGEK